MFGLLKRDARLEARRGIKQKLSQLEIKKRRADDVRSQLAQLDVRSDKAAADHVKNCEPIQSELADLENKMAAALAAREPVNEKHEIRRRELLQALYANNEELEREIATIDRLRVKLRKQIDETLAEQREAIELELSLSSRYASPELQIAKFVAHEAMETQRFRLERATKKLRERKEQYELQRDTRLQGRSVYRGSPGVGKYETIVSEAGEHEATLKFQYDCWQAEADAAQTALAEAKAAWNFAHQQIFDE